MQWDSFIHWVACAFTFPRQSHHSLHIENIQGEHMLFPAQTGSRRNKRKRVCWACSDSSPQFAKTQRYFFSFHGNWRDGNKLFELVSTSLSVLIHSFKSISKSHLYLHLIYVFLTLSLHIHFIYVNFLFLSSSIRFYNWT